MSLSTLRTPRPAPPGASIDGAVPGVRGHRAFPTRAQGVLDPFLMLDHIGPQRVSADFQVAGHPHPHRGFETVTFLFEGAMEHADTLGNRFWMRSGAVQVMNAGRGIQHGGGMAADPGVDGFHEVQLWLNVPARHKMSVPSVATYAAAQIPTVPLDGGAVRVVAGEAFGQIGPARPTVPLLALHAHLRGGGELSVPVPRGWTALAYPLRGALRSGDSARPGLVTFEDDGDLVRIEAGIEGAEVLLLAAPPLREPVAMGGPFVMSTREEIRQAYADFRAGRFGSVPAAPCADRSV